jgi:hypothetical protein
MLHDWGQNNDQFDEHGGWYPWTEKDMSRKVEWALGQSYSGKPGDRLNGLIDLKLHSLETQALEVIGSSALDEATITQMAKAGIVGPDFEETYWSQGRSSRPKRQGYKIKDLYCLPPPKWQIERHIQTDTVNLLYGPFGTCKSFLALDMGLSVASGKPFLGIFGVMQSPVCYIAAEGQAGLKKRIHAWCEHHRQPPPEQFCVIPEVFDLSEEDEYREAMRIAKDVLGTVPSLIFVDTLARHFGCRDENSTKDMSGFVNSITTMGRETGAAIVVLHHTGKDLDKGPRGNVALPAACDTMIATAGSTKTHITVSCKKQKDCEQFAPYSLDAKKIIGSDDPDGSLVLVPLNRTKAALADLGSPERGTLEGLNQSFEQRVWSFTDGQGTVKSSKTTYNRHLQTLVNLGLVQRVGGGSYQIDPAAAGILLIG